LVAVDEDDDLDLGPLADEDDLEIEEPVLATPAPSAAIRSGMFQTVPDVAPPDVRALEAAVADDPDDPSRHRALGEALLEVGDRVRALEELDHALGAYESREDWQHAHDLAEEIIRLDPNSVRHHQKRVEYAFRSGDRDHLIAAYLELADGLFRTGAVDRARAVYLRVVEHDVDNPRARTALSTLEPEVEAPAPAGGTSRAASTQAPTSAPAPAPGPAAAARKPPAGDFIDLGALILEEEEEPVRDTRMRIQDEEPTGDEQRDFQEMLSQFKKGIEANLGEDDAQAHYDLGVAFKEMGLLDEAIAEFQKALRGEGKLRTSEALGICFFEKGQYTVAGTVLKRAVETDPATDADKIGLLYWLGRCSEEQGRVSEGLVYYQRALGVDIRFMDVAKRVQMLSAK